jgi:hypothetical protein
MFPSKIVVCVQRFLGEIPRIFFDRLDNKRIRSIMITMSNTNTSNGVISASDYKTISQSVLTRIQSGERVSLLGLAKEYGVSTNEMRQILTEEFGSRVSFVRGRSGGVRIV